MDLEQESYDEFDDFYSHRTKSHAKEEYSVFGHGEVDDDEVDDDDDVEEDSASDGQAVYVERKDNGDIVAIFNENA